jgi:hypothetical protein
MNLEDEIRLECNRDVDIIAAIGEKYHRPNENNIDPKERSRYIIPKADLEKMEYDPNHVPTVYKITKPETDLDNSLVLKKMKTPAIRKKSAGSCWRTMRGNRNMRWMSDPATRTWKVGHPMNPTACPSPTTWPVSSGRTGEGQDAALQAG